MNHRQELARTDSPRLSVCIATCNSGRFIGETLDSLLSQWARIVAAICDALPAKRPEWINAGFAQFSTSLMRSVAKCTDHVIAISRAMVADLVEYFRLSEKSISAVHMGMCGEWFEPVPAPKWAGVLKKDGLTHGYFIFVGTLQSPKNVEGIVAVYEDLPGGIESARQRIVAGQAGRESAPVQERIGALQRKRKRLWLQYVPAKDLRALYQCAGAFVFPSLWEEFGVPVLGAFASAVPVVTSNLSSLPDIAGDAAVLVDPCDVSELREAMSRLQELLRAVRLLSATFSQSIITHHWSRV